MKKFYMFSVGDPGDKHPQEDLINSNIERAVQDIFLDSLRRQAPELIYIFSDETQIDNFIKRFLKYWESLEKYEICKEVLDLVGPFKEKWRERDYNQSTIGLERIKDLFNIQK